MAKWQNGRYRLAHSRDIKKNRWNNVCPSCGQRKFSPYIDTTTNKPIAEKVCGRCCREKSCAYHLRPSEWFKDNPPEKREWLPREQYIELMRQRRREARGASPPALSQGEGASSAMPASPLLGRGKGEAASYLSHMSELCARTRSDRNHLARWLSTLFPEEQVAATLARYRTGSTRDGRIIYWQIDEHEQVRTGKVMAYNPDGHRRKEGKGNVCWVHSIRVDGIRFDEMLVPQCLFGLHLLNDNVDVNENENENDNDNHYPLRNCVILSEAKNLAKHDDDDVNDNLQRNIGLTIHGDGGEASPCLVESEKTALIMSILCPGRVWLATGGKQNLKEAMLWPLVGMEVSLYPDADALTDWYTRAMEFNRTLGTKLHIPTWYYDLMNHPEAKAAGWDLADVIISRGEFSPPY